MPTPESWELRPEAISQLIQLSDNIKTNDNITV